MTSILESPRKSLEAVVGCTLPQPVPIVEEMDLHRSLRACGSWGFPNHPRPSDLFLFNERLGMDGSSCQTSYIVLSTDLSQLLGSTDEIAPNILHRTALLNCSVHRKHVFLPLIIIYGNLKGQTHNLMIRRRGLVPSSTQKQLNLRTSGNRFAALPFSQEIVNTHRNMLGLAWLIAYTWQESKFIARNSKNIWEAIILLLPIPTLPQLYTDHHHHYKFPRLGF